MQPRYLLRDNEPFVAQRIDQYPNSPLARHSVNALTQSWTGTIVVLASIELYPTDADWFEVVNETVIGTMGMAKNLMWTIDGCLVWMKVELRNISGLGRIDRITAL